MSYEELLDDKTFEKLDEVEHKDVKNFIRREMTGNQGWSLIAKIYQILGLFLVAFAFVKAFAPFLRQHRTDYLIGMGWGVVFTLTFLIFLHELLHAAAYLAVGARKISFGLNLKKFLFYVQADKQVLNYKKFKIVALTPVITVALLTLAGAIIYFGKSEYYFCVTILGLHSLFCAGDLGLLCFFENRPEDKIVTFDVKQEGKTYFYKEKAQNKMV